MKKGCISITEMKKGTQHHMEIYVYNITGERSYRHYMSIYNGIDTYELYVVDNVAKIFGK